MVDKLETQIIISPYQHLPQVLEQPGISHVVSILGRADKLDWPEVGSRAVLRLAFDDIGYSSDRFIAPNEGHIADLIAFARSWNGNGSIALQCRAGTARSPAAAMIAVAALGWPNSASIAMRVATAKAYFKSNSTMLRLADSLLPQPYLLDLARAIPVPTHNDEWGPVSVNLRTLAVD